MYTQTNKYMCIYLKKKKDVTQDTDLIWGVVLGTA